MKTKSYQCWLQFDKIQNEQIRLSYSKQCGAVIVPRSSDLLATAKHELIIGLQSLLGVSPIVQGEDAQAGNGRIIIGTAGDHPLLEGALTQLGTSTIKANTNNRDRANDSYVISTGQDELGSYIALAGASDRAVIYAVFHFLKLLQLEADVTDLSIQEIPVNGIRMMNQWDNMDGSIERGYAGESIFYENNKIVEDLSRIQDYARLLASIGINAITINNVNVHAHETKLISDEQLPNVERLAAVFRAYGIQLFLSINYASPIELGGLTTADPLATEVAAWWNERAKAIYKIIPDFGGFLVKADSENRPGPFTYGRNHMDGANMLATALEPFGGIVVWRCFVYNCHQDWRDRKTDRARAAYDHFMPLDDQFKDNVILQIKNGPMDFQVREPISPLFGGLEHTNQILELQITQEYTGQQRHVCYLVPQWKEILDFDTCAKGEGSTVAKVASGELFGNLYGGIAAVSNIGNDMNWTGHDLAQANLYGYGRLIWNPSLSAEEITNEWVKMTFRASPETMNIISDMLLRSWSIYENYTSPLGVGWMVNPDHHYGPNVDGYEYSKWGTYHFADCKGIGVDRTVATGTGYSSQYRPEVAKMYDSLEACPDELLLFFHHVSYEHVLDSGKTVIQHIYDSHFDGAAQAEELITSWKETEKEIDAERFQAVLLRLKEQAEHAAFWRDMINTYFLRKSGIPDQGNRKIYS
ncbi:alpha-glucuronidase family glycosyl hydrolase [Paenibacillus turicensis]|uniref:alpha-glucuronidase family glycosyl hydrolase n=1 Tax=Paenibacillus turicensis TaxID=160487 RepID=UPI003D29B925